MTPERIAEIKQIIESVRKSGRMPYEAMHAIDEMMAVIERIPDLDYVLNVDATWKAEKRKIEKLKIAGDMLHNVMLAMRCCAELKESPEKEECENMGLAMRTWEATKNNT